MLQWCLRLREFFSCGGGSSSSSSSSSSTGSSSCSSRGANSLKKNRTVEKNPSRRVEKKILSKVWAVLTQATVTEFNEGSIVAVVAVGRDRCSVCVRRISLEILEKLTWENLYEVVFGGPFCFLSPAASALARSQHLLFFLAERGNFGMQWYSVWRQNKIDFSRFIKRVLFLIISAVNEKKSVYSICPLGKNLSFFGEWCKNHFYF